MKGKKFQILSIEDTPGYLPFISRKEGADIKQAAIYIRRGTSDELVTEEELSKILERRARHIYPETGKPLDLTEHLEQLKVLYNNIKPTISKLKDSDSSLFVQAVKAIEKFKRGLAVEYEYEKNPLYRSS